MSGHTPGPWRVREVTFSGDSRPSYGVEPPDGKSWILLPQHNEANARLIAAAPVLLASARETYKYSAFHQSDCRGVASYAEGEISDPTIGCDCYLARLKAAIAKAEGNQS